MRCFPTGLTREVCLCVASVAVIFAFPKQTTAFDPDSNETFQHCFFSGSLVSAGNAENEILRRFEAELLSSNRRHFFHVMDDPRSGCPWPDSFGYLPSQSATQSVVPHLVYPFDGNTHLINLPPLKVYLPENLSDGTEWDQADWRLKAIDTQTIDGSPAWVIEAREKRGRQQRLIVDADSGLTLRAETDVFMGQGDRFLLTLSRVSCVSIPADKSKQISELITGVTSLQAALNRRPDSYARELSRRQVESIFSGMEQLSRLAAETPLENLVKQIRADAEQQKKRLDAAENRATSLMNSPAPQFSLSLVSGGNLSSSDTMGKTVILHFWDYKDSPLAEPYGQTGYLEFLFNSRKDSGVVVIGVSTNPDLQTAENANRGRRSARKLSEFMNLTYPIGFDDGSLLQKLGDPRESKGQLPVWVVISADGRVVHYHAGFYEVDVSKGLKELETVVSVNIPQQ